MYADALRRFLGCRGNLIFLTTSVVSLAAAATIGFDAWTPLWLAIGVITYAPQEHLVHKFIFHAPAPRNRFLYRVLYRLHFGHHDTPNRLDILFTPVWFVLTVLAVNLAVMVSLHQFAGVPLVHALTWLGAFMGSYVTFEWLHLLVHMPHPPRTRLMRFLRRRHLAHHYRDYDRWFTVFPLGVAVDFLLRTGGRIRDVPNRPAPRTLGLPRDDARVLAARAHYLSGTDGDATRSSIWLDHAGKAEAAR